MSVKTPSKKTLPHITRAEGVAKKLLVRLQSGTHASDKLPSQRVLAHEFGVSRNTVAAALQILKASGMIRLADRRVARVTNADTPLTQKLGKFLSSSNFAPPLVHAAFSKEDENAVLPRDTINLSTLCDEHWDNHINAEFEQIAAARALQKYRNGETGIYRSTGIAKLKEVLLPYLSEVGIKARPEEIAIIPRRLQTYRQITDILSGPGTEVWVPELSLFRFYGITDRLAARQCILPMTAAGETDFSPMWLSRRPRLVFLEPDRQRPTGASLPAEQRKNLVKEAAGRHVFLFEDCYSSALYQKRTPPLMAYDTNKESVIHMAGLPTWLSPLACFSYIVANERIISLLRASVRRDYLNPEFLSQLCAIELAEADTFNEMRRRFHAFHEERLVRIDRALAQYFGGQARWKLPGSFGCIWLELPDTDIAKLYQARRDVDFHPGWFFGESQAHCRHVLLRYTLPEELFMEGLKRFHALWKQCRGR